MAAIQKYVGIAPVTEHSGNKCWVHWRLQSDDRARALAYDPDSPKQYCLRSI